MIVFLFHALFHPLKQLEWYGKGVDLKNDTWYDKQEAYGLFWMEF